LAENASLKFVGIGTVDSQAQLVSSGMIEPAEIDEIAAAGGVGELLGHFFDAQGRILSTTLTGRTLAASFGKPGGHRIVAVAGGMEKVAAIAAVLMSHRLTGLITDEATAKALVGDT
jgi:DNA-binding transcriptional regulator LsrR (DeoR family)